MSLPPMSSQDHFNHVQNVAQKWISLTDAQKEAYFRKCGHKLTVQRFVNFPSNNIPVSTMNDAVKVLGSGGNHTSFGGQQLFSDAEEDCLLAYLKTCASHGEAPTRLEFLTVASRLLKVTRPDLTKKVVLNHRKCSEDSGKAIDIEYGQISYHWMRGFFGRMTSRHGVTFAMLCPEFLETTRAEVTIDALAANHKEFIQTLAEHGIDLDTEEGRERVGNIDESGISGTKSSKKTCSQRVIMPSCVKARPIRKIHPNRGHVTSLNGGTMAGYVLPTVFIDKSANRMEVHAGCLLPHGHRIMHAVDTFLPPQILINATCKL